MISQVLVPLQMRLPSPMPPFHINIHALSYAVIFDIDNKVRQQSATFYQSSQDGYHDIWLMLTG